MRDKRTQMRRNHGAEVLTEARKLAVSLRRLVRSVRLRRNAPPRNPARERAVLIQISVNFALFLVSRPIMATTLGATSADHSRNIPWMLLLAVLMGVAFIVLHRVMSGSARWIVLAAVGLACAGLGGFLFDGFSIIAFVWSGIITASAVCVAAGRNYVEALVRDAEATRENDGDSAALGNIQTAVHFVIARTVESLFAIAAIGGVCGSILFKSGWENIETKLNAAWMAVGFGLLSLLCLAWLLLPALQALTALRGTVDRAERPAEP